MKNIVKKLSTTLTIVLVMFISSFQAMADDTEIFFSSAALNGSTTIQPNVLLILDTSGSMTNQVGTTGMTRLEHMKEAMHTILDSTNNINIGIMRFHRKGGPVLFPVADINADVNDVLGTTTVPGTFNRIKLANDDVEESAGTVDATGDELVIGNDSGFSSCGAAGLTTVEVRIEDDDDDVEEDKDGDVHEGSSDLELVYDTHNNRQNQHVGLLFKDVNVPNGAIVHCAEIEFEIDEHEDDATDLKVFIQDIGDAPDFIDGNDTYDVTGRINAAVDPHVVWDEVEELNVNEKLTTPDLRTLVQSVVDRVDWAADNEMAFIINGTGRRTVEAHDGEPSNAALLRISYSNTPVGVTNQKVGLRFDEVRIPKGSTITAAYIDFNSNNETHADASAVNIYAEDVDHSAAFTAGASSDVTNRISNKTTNSPVAWSVPTWNPNTTYSTPDIKDMVQDVVNRTGWCGGNAMTFLLEATSGTRKAISDDGDSSTSPALRIEFDEATATGCNAQQVQAQIKSDNDDAEEDTEGASIGSVDLGSSDIELNEDGSTSQLAGLRFQNINIDSSNTITSAEIEFTVDDDDTDTSATSLTIYGEYTGSASAFSNSSNNISGRTKTTASVNWSPSHWSVSGEKHVTPDISSIITEIIGHSGWSALNDMAFIIEGTSGERTAESYDGDPINAAKLRINITGSGLSSAGTTTVRDTLHNVIDEIQWANRTPIVDTLYEGGLYYRGDSVYYGKTRAGGETLSPLSENDGYRMRYSRTSHPASYTGPAATLPAGCTLDNLSAASCEDARIEGTATYISPIKHECQDNHIVLLSDGSPSEWHQDSVPSPYYGSVSSCAGTGNGKCGVEIATFLNNNDQIDDATLDDDQKITTHTIGFNFAGSTYLQDLATAGGGGFYEASTAAQLAATFSEIFADVLQSPTSFVAPAVTINTFNRLSHRDELYFALFEPSDNPRWQGNLKRYKLDTASGTPQIVDFNGAPAVSATTGYFATGAESWWTGSSDGQEISVGGFAGELDTTRNVYTYTGTNSTLSDSSNHLKDSNTALTDTMLDIVAEQTANSSFRSTMLSWIGGVDVLDENDDGSFSDARKFVGDPLHSRPALITYGGTSSAPDTVAYFGTNEGYIHALDVDDGSEIFAFMPQELLPNIKLLMANQGSPQDHKYGVDGTITPWIKDVNNDRSIVAGDGDHVYLYTGMRRGGDSYYALDVTNRNSPKLLWTINGGSGDFTELGQSWSRPVKSIVDIGGTKKDVLIFAGGYDANQDGATTPQNDNVGRALYIVDANTGARLWWAGPAGSGADLELANLTNSMPASPAVVDLDVDGAVDHVYIGDLGGRVWRFDFTHGNNASSFGSATLLATLGDTDSNTANDAENNRRFYHTPSVALKDPLASQTLYVAIGSGFHAHPLNEDAHDRFYVLEDTDVINSGSMTLPLTESAIYDATDNIIQDGSSAQQAAAQVLRDAASGWYIRLEENSSTQIGEKVLSRATIFDNTLLFSTYLPDDLTSSSVSVSCQAAAGVGRTYGVNLDDGSAVFNPWDGDASDLDVDDRYYKLTHVGIPPEVQIIIPGGSLAHGIKPVLLVGTEIVDTDFDSPQPEMIYWNDK